MPAVHGARIAAYNRAREDRGDFRIAEYAGVANLGNHHSEDTRQHLSEVLTGRSKSMQTRARMSAAQKGREIRPEHRAKLSAAMSGRKLSIEHRIAIGRAAGGYRGGQRRWEWLDASGRLFRFRSGWERTFAKRLDAAGLTWQYEPHALLLSDGRVYLPDFFVSEWLSYVEVKGWLGRHTMTKYEQAVRDGHPMKLVTDPSVPFEMLLKE